jgi:hypothetical protein
MVFLHDNFTKFYINFLYPHYVLYHGGTQNHGMEAVLTEILWLAAPSSPQNVTVLVLNPTTVEVQWLPPQEFNDERVWYEIHWCTEGMVAGVRQKSDEDVMNTDSMKNIHRADLKNLMPGQTYQIWVRYSCIILLTCNTSPVVMTTCSTQLQH